MHDKMGFLTTLFDFSFSEFVTTKVIKYAYALGIILAGIAAIAVIGSSFAKSIALGILMLILSPFIFLLYVLITRIWMEIIIVIFRIAENTKKLSDKG